MVFHFKEFYNYNNNLQERNTYINFRDISVIHNLYIIDNYNLYFLIDLKNGKQYQFTGYTKMSYYDINSEKTIEKLKYQYDILIKNFVCNNTSNLKNSSPIIIIDFTSVLNEKKPKDENILDVGELQHKIDLVKKELKS